jgi:uncharacterized protein YecA (UPF0149 family)
VHDTRNDTTRHDATRRDATRRDTTRALITDHCFSSCSLQFAAPKLGIKDDRKRPKVGRNEPCPACSSGKKFKACCWNKYEN